MQTEDTYLYYELKACYSLNYFKDMLQIAQEKKGSFNMLESTIFDLINTFASKIYEKDGRIDFSNYIKENQETLAWGKSLFKVYFDEQKLNATNLGRLRAPN